MNGILGKRKRAHHLMGIKFCKMRIKFCKFCSTANSPAAMYCIHCGTLIGSRTNLAHTGSIQAAMLGAHHTHPNHVLLYYRNTIHLLIVMTCRMICFDLEGPLSPQDNAYEVMALTGNGDRVFEVLSRYDDILALEERPGYEPGDTLALAVPFLLLHGIGEDNVRRVSEHARIVGGAGEMIAQLRESGWQVRIISTSYRQHAHNIASRIGVPPEDVACTQLDLEALHGSLNESGMKVIDSAEKDILDNLYPNMEDDSLLKDRLDRFFYEELPGAGYGDVFEKVRVVGGSRKVEAMMHFMNAGGVSTRNSACVGDSITDWRMLQHVRDGGGLAVVFNGNAYAVPHANAALGTVDMRFLDMFTINFVDSGLDGVRRFAELWENSLTLQDISETQSVSDISRNFVSQDFKDDFSRIPDEYLTENLRTLLVSGEAEMVPCYHWVMGAGEERIKDVVSAHKIFRSAVRGRAAKLG